jgi:hypothetical protein
MECVNAPPTFPGRMLFYVRMRDDTEQDVETVVISISIFHRAGKNLATHRTDRQRGPRKVIALLSSYHLLSEGS